MLFIPRSGFHCVCKDSEFWNRLQEFHKKKSVKAQKSDVSKMFVIHFKLLYIKCLTRKMTFCLKSLSDYIRNLKMQEA